MSGNSNYTLVLSHIETTLKLIYFTNTFKRPQWLYSDTGFIHYKKYLLFADIEP